VASGWRPLVAVLGGASALAAAGWQASRPGWRETGDWQEPAPAMFQTGPYILLGAPGQAFVALKADGMPAPTVEWWIAPTVAANEGAPAPAVEVHRVEGGAPRRPLGRAARGPAARAGGELQGEVGARRDPDPESSTPGPPPGAKFRFAVFGDTRDGHSVHRQLVEMVDR
jgi:hypothetical protein